jgi:nitrite reductase (NADH) large subunit
MKQKLVVIGNGMAGARVVEELVQRGGNARFDITMFGAEPHGNYNRIMLSNVLNGSMPASDIFLNPLEWYQENQICLHAGIPVTRIDREGKNVHWGEAQSTSYDALVIATGSRPLVPPLDGLKLEDGTRKPGVFVMRTLDDCARIAGYANKCRRAVVIGGGLLGLEAARGLMQHGAQVTVVHRSGILMNQQLDATSGAMLKASIEKLGIKVLLNHDSRAVLGDDASRASLRG